MNSELTVMWHRQVKKFFRNKQRIFVSLFQPLLFLVAFGFGFGRSFDSSDGTSYVQYLIPGIVGMTLLFSSTMSGMSLIWDKKFGFLKETLVAPISRTKLLFGRCLGGATTSLFQGLIVTFLGYVMGFRIENWVLFPLIIAAIFIIALLFSLIGTLIATKFDDMSSFPIIMNIVLMPMMFLSSAFFPVENYPNVIQFVVKINPFNYCVNLLRYLMSGFETNMFLLSAVIAGLIFLFGALGTGIFNRIEV